MNDENCKTKQVIILEAARKRFAHFGYSKVTMDEIAGDVEMGKASLYYYYPTKENLFEAVIEGEQKEFVLEIEKMLARDISAAEKLKKYISKRLEYFNELINIGTLSAHSLFDNKSIFKHLFKSFQFKELELLQQIIDEGIKNSEFEKKHQKDIAKILLHIMHGLRFRTLVLLKGSVLEEKEFKVLYDEMMLTAEIFINGIKTK